MSGANACVLVSIGGDVGDELLGRESEEASERQWCLRWWWKASEGEVVRCYCVWDLFEIVSIIPARMVGQTLTIGA